MELSHKIQFPDKFAMFENFNFKEQKSLVEAVASSTHYSCLLCMIAKSQDEASSIAKSLLADNLTFD
jgi:hypothetical protein